jgi:hypothetical protein
VMKSVKYEIYRISMQRLHSNSIHPAEIFGFEKLLMRQKERDSSTFWLAARAILATRRFYEWYENNIFDAFMSGIDLGRYAYLQQCVKRLTEVEMR